jgi:hypothetical protein
MKNRNHPSHSQKKYAELFSESDKKIIENLRQKIQIKINHDPEFQKKAALILSSWINSKK